MNGEHRFRLPPYRVESVTIALAETVDWGLSNYQIPQQWRDTRGQGVRVAVLDTGVEEQHPDLKDSIDEARDFTGSMFGPSDRAGHGTHVAGTIGARRNQTGVIGVAPECRLLIGKVLGDDGSGRDDQVAAGIDWACDSGADILSMSLGSPQPSAAIAAAIQRAVAKGKFVICAAGNSGRPNSVDYPAKLPETVAVGAVDRHGRVARFSSQGDEVDICAPGEDVLSTYLNGSYAKLSGTSMATPFVSGVVALMLAKHRLNGGQSPIHNNQQLIAHLQKSATDAGPTGKDPSYGYGLIDPALVLQGATPIVASPEFRISPIQINGVTGALLFVPEGNHV